MNTRSPLLISIALIAAMIGFSAWTWSDLPSTQIAIHWDIHNRPNGFASKAIALSIAPALAILLTMLFALWPSIEPRRGNLASSRLTYSVAWVGAIGVVAATHVIIVMSARSAAVNVGVCALTAAAVLLVVLGNFVGKSRANFILGLRTPWSLTSDLAWGKSNRLYGRLILLTGLATLIALAFTSFPVAVGVLIGGVVLATACGIAASYLYWKRDSERRSGDGIFE